MKIGEQFNNITMRIGLLLIWLPRLYRIRTKTGLISNNLGKGLKIEGVFGRKIVGVAGILLDMPLINLKYFNKFKSKLQLIITLLVLYLHNYNVNLFLFFLK